MNLIRKLIAEFYAVALFSFTVFCTGNNAILVGFAFWMGIQGTGFINPFHYNPMVQIASLFHKRLTHYLNEKDKLYLLLSIPIQIIGSLVGCLFGWWIYESNFYFKPNSDFTISQYFIAEAIYSSHIVLICLGVGQWSESKLIGLFAISGGITAGIYTVGKLSGACFNPTVCFVVNFVHAMKSNSSEGLEHL